MNSQQKNTQQNTAQNSATNQNAATIYGSNAAMTNAANTANTGNTAFASGPSAAAAALINQATNPANTIGNLGAFLNPYTQNVVNAQMALQNQQNAIQAQQLQGNAAAQGALGGDRAAIAQAVLAGQQALANNATNAGILNQGYNTALQAAMQTAGQQLQGAGLSGTQGSQASQQFGSTQGAQSSQTLGGTNTAMSQANAAAGTGSGSTTTSTIPGIGTYAGLGLGLLGVADGGPIRLADGGPPDGMPAGPGLLPAFSTDDMSRRVLQALEGGGAQKNPNDSSPDFNRMKTVGRDIGDAFLGEGAVYNNNTGDTPDPSSSGGDGGGSDSAYAKGGAASRSSTQNVTLPSIGSLPYSAFFTPVSFAPVQAPVPSLMQASTSFPMLPAVTVPQAQMPSVPFPYAPRASSGKGSGGAVRGFNDPDPQDEYAVKKDSDKGSGDNGNPDDSGRQVTPDDRGTGLAGRFGLSRSDQDAIAKAGRIFAAFGEGKLAEGLQKEDNNDLQELKAILAAPPPSILARPAGWRGASTPPAPAPAVAPNNGGQSTNHVTGNFPNVYSPRGYRPYQGADTTIDPINPPYPFYRLPLGQRHGGAVDARVAGMPAPPSADGPPHAYPHARRAPDGHWYIPDSRSGRNGKYLKVLP